MSHWLGSESCLILSLPSSVTWKHNGLNPYASFMLLLELPDRQCESCNGVSLHCSSHVEPCAGSNDIHFRKSSQFHLIILTLTAPFWIILIFPPFLFIFFLEKWLPFFEMRLHLKIIWSQFYLFHQALLDVPKQNLLDLYVCPALCKCSTSGS